EPRASSRGAVEESFRPVGDRRRHRRQPDRLRRLASWAASRAGRRRRLRTCHFQRLPKLIHGGLRYLPMGDLALIREAHLERIALMTRVAPHLVRPLRFLLPVYGGGPHRTALIAAGLFVYAALSGFREAEIRVVRPARAHDLIPAVQLRG